MRSLLVLMLAGILAGLGIAAWGLSQAPSLRTWLFGVEPPAPAAALDASKPPILNPSPSIAAPATLPSEMAARLAALESRLARLEGLPLGGRDSSRAEGLLIAFAARRALEKGMALGYVEGELNRQFGAAQPRAVAMIVAAARAPVTRESLRTELDRIAPQLGGGGADESWWDGLRRGVASMIIVRQPGAPSPDPQARIARARDLVASGRVDQALAEVARLSNRAAADRWIGDARRYVEAQRALDLLEAAAILPQTAAPVAVPSKSSEKEASAEPAAGATAGSEDTF